MNKAHRILIVSLAVFVFIPAIVGAVTIENPLTHNTFGELLKAIVEFMIKLAVPIGVIMIMIAGIFFVTARGDPVKIQTAQKMLFWIVVGLVIIFGAWIIIGVIEYVFNIEIAK